MGNDKDHKMIRFDVQNTIRKADKIGRDRSKYSGYRIPA